MKENLILANYKVESEAYQALSELKRETTNANYTISQAMIVKKENGKLNVMDGFVSGTTTSDDTWTGGLIGSLVGVLGGPIGVLLGGSVGMLIGGAVDAGDMADNVSLLEKAGDALTDGLTEEQKELFEEYMNAQREVNVLTDCETFCLAFKLGAKIMLDVLTDGQMTEI